jgi:hypothetical protein
LALSISSRGKINNLFKCVKCKRIKPISRIVLNSVRKFLHETHTLCWMSTFDTCPRWPFPWHQIPCPSLLASISWITPPAC